MAIQFHDNLSQRMEHVAKGLNDVVKMNSETNPKSNGNDNNNGKLTTAHAIIDLQNAQIKQAISEIDSVYQKSRSALTAIGRETHGLASSLSSLSQGDSDDGPETGHAVNDPFTTLKPALSDLDRLLCQGGGLIDRIRDTSTHASGAAKELFSYMGQIRKLSHETHIKALNAIVNAAHMGDAGKTQEVLAQEIKILSDHTRQFVDEVSGVLESISESVGDLGEKTAAGSGSVCTSADTDDGHISLDAGIEEISEIYTRFNENSADVFYQAGPLEDKISQAGSALEFLPALAVNLLDQQKQLEEIRSMLEPWARTDTADTDTMTARYTMQQEREVHEKLVVARNRDTMDADAEGLRRDVVEAGPEERSSRADFAEDVGALSQSDKEIESDGAVESLSDENTDEEDFGDNVDLF